jgi:hypothetical protein
MPHDRVLQRRLPDMNDMPQLEIAPMRLLRTARAAMSARAEYNQRQLNECLPAEGVGPPAKLNLGLITGNTVTRLGKMPWFFLHLQWQGLNISYFQQPVNSTIR